MKKIIVLLSVAVLALAGAQHASAIEDPNPKGNLTLSANFTVAPGANFTGEVVVATVKIGHISVGRTMGYMFKPMLFTSALTSSKQLQNLPTTVDENPHHTLYLAPRATFGVNLTKKLQVYAGAYIGAGVNLGHYTITGDTIKRPGAEFAFVIGEINGIRFFFNDHFAAQAELNFGTNTPIVNLGAAFRF